MRLFREHPKYITRRPRGYLVRVTIGGAPRYPKIRLGQFPTIDKANQALREFGLLLVELHCPVAAKEELYRRIGAPIDGKGHG